MAEVPRPPTGLAEVVDLPPRGPRAPPPAARGLRPEQERQPAGSFFGAFRWEPKPLNPADLSAGQFFGGL